MADRRSSQVEKPRRAAILVGVGNYRPDGYVSAPAGGVVMLRNLNTPCKDVEEISAKLKSVNWHFDNSDPDAEIHTYCDADLGTIQSDITRRISDLDKPGDLLIIYLAGHGAEIAGRSYFFGPLAKLDIPATVDRLRTYSKNLLFVGQALDINRTIQDPAGLIYNGNILVIFGACRDDPLSYGEIARALDLRVGPPFIETNSLGVRILYATMPGSAISDGVGLSFLARAFANHIRQDVRIYDAINDASKDVRTETANDRLETPITLGDFRDTSLCFSGCGQSAILVGSNALESPRTEPIVLKQASFQNDVREGHTFRYDQLPRAPDGIGFQTVRPRPAIEKIEALKVAPLGVDIYWCESGGMSAHQKEADTIASSLAALGDSKDIAGPGTMLGSVRTRALPDGENARPGLRFARNAVRYETGNAPAAALAKRINDIASFPFYIESVPGNSLDTINVFVCSGGRHFPKSERLFIQAASESQRGLALYLSSRIERDYPNLWVADAVDIRPRTQHSSPNHTLVKYFDRTDRNLANQISTTLDRWLASRAVAVYAGTQDSDTSPKRGLIELWLGKDLDPTTVATDD
jgi:hypothetical protein